jgi:hypothetical protein
MRVSRVMLLAVLVLGLTGCGRSGSSAPSSPSPMQPLAPQAGSVLMNGYVADTLFRPLAGVKVEVLDGPQAGAFTTSGSTGEFSMTGTFDDTTRFRASKADLVTATATLTPKCPTCSQRFIYFYLAGTAPPVSMAGDYTLTFMADPACAGLPDDVRTRTYAATMTPVLDSHVPLNTVLQVAVSGASFLQYYDSFSIGVAGHDVAMELRGEGPSLVERVAPNRYLAFDGRADASVGTAAVSSIAASFDGTIDYCELTSDMGASYNCAVGSIVHAPCTSKSHRLILTRR